MTAINSSASIDKCVYSFDQIMETHEGMKIYIANAKAALSASLGRFFYTRPALKRAGLVLLLYCGPPLVAAIFSAAIPIGGIWALMLTSLFWGMGAERAAVEWDDVFSLPPLSAFAFWRWHGLEKKRFLAALAALLAGWAVTVAEAVLL